MNDSFLITLAATGFGVAFLHAAIPTHWLPFVAIGRARGWTRRRTLAAVALAGGGHILATTAFGVALAWFGFELEERFHEIFHWVTAAILVGLGAWLAFRAPHGAACAHCQGNPGKLVPDATDRAALWGLFLTLTLSPCELFLPVYLTAVPFGWRGIAWLSAVLALATLGGMLALTWLMLLGVERLRVGSDAFFRRARDPVGAQLAARSRADQGPPLRKGKGSEMSHDLRLRWLDRLDQRVIGGLLCLLGLATVVLEH